RAWRVAAPRACPGSRQCLPYLPGAAHSYAGGRPPGPQQHTSNRHLVFIGAAALGAKRFLLPAPRRSRTSHRLISPLTRSVIARWPIFEGPRCRLLSGGVVAGATVEISYAVSGFHREATTGSDGSFKFTNVPFNSYHLAVTAGGFENYSQDVDVRSAVPTAVQISLKIGTAVQTVNV